MPGPERSEADRQHIQQIIDSLLGPGTAPEVPPLPEFAIKELPAVATTAGFNLVVDVAGGEAVVTPYPEGPSERKPATADDLQTALDALLIGRPAVDASTLPDVFPVSPPEKAAAESQEISTTDSGNLERVAPSYLLENFDATSSYEGPAEPFFPSFPLEESPDTRGTRLAGAELDEQERFVASGIQPSGTPDYEAVGRAVHSMLEQASQRVAHLEEEQSRLGSETAGLALTDLMQKLANLERETAQLRRLVDENLRDLIERRAEAPLVDSASTLPPTRQDDVFWRGSIAAETPQRPESATTPDASLPLESLATFNFFTPAIDTGQASAEPPTSTAAEIGSAAASTSVSTTEGKDTGPLPGQARSGGFLARLFPARSAKVEPAAPKTPASPNPGSVFAGPVEIEVVSPAEAGQTLRLEQAFRVTPGVEIRLVWGTARSGTALLLELRSPIALLAMLRGWPMIASAEDIGPRGPVGRIQVKLREQTDAYH